MIAVIFEVWPKPEHRQEYFDLAAELRPILETIDGFISIERFESLTEKGKILSLSFFRDEAAVAEERQRRSEEHTSELKSHSDLVCRLLLEKKKKKKEKTESKKNRK